MIELSEKELQYIWNIRFRFEAPVMVTGGVAISHWLPDRKAPDLDLVVPVFQYPGRWSDALLMVKPPDRRVDLNLVREKHLRKWGADYFEVLLDGIAHAALIRIDGYPVKVAPVDYLVWIKRKMVQLRDDPKDHDDLNRLEAL